MLLALVDDREVFDAMVAGVGRVILGKKIGQVSKHATEIRRERYGRGEHANELRLASMVGF